MEYASLVIQSKDYIRNGLPLEYMEPTIRVYMNSLKFMWYILIIMSGLGKVYMHIWIIFNITVIHLSFFYLFYFCSIIKTYNVFIYLYIGFVSSLFMKHYELLATVPKNSESDHDVEATAELGGAVSADTSIKTKDGKLVSNGITVTEKQASNIREEENTTFHMTD